MTFKYDGFVEYHPEEKSYDIDKVVPACTTCNIMIGTNLITKFREMCEHIAIKSGKLKEGNLYPNHFVFNPNYTYEYAKSCAENKGQPFNLTYDEFNAVIIAFVKGQLLVMLIN